MAAAWWYLVAACCAIATISASPAQNREDARGRQLVYYAPQQAPQPQRLVSNVDSTAAAQFYQPNQLKQDVQTFSVTSEDKGRGEKLETLEPDAELLPGVQQAQNPTAQVPVSPAAGIPRLLPGQQVYIVNPQHQIYMNALYPGLTNGFRPNVQIPGYQRFFIVPQATAGDGSIAGPGGYQNTILVDPSGQPVAPQYFQPNYQRFMAPTPLRPQAHNSAPDKAEPSNTEPAKLQESFNNIQGGSLGADNPGLNRNANREPTRSAEQENIRPSRIGENIRDNYQGGYQQAVVAAQPQFGFAAQQNAFPFFGYRQPVYQGQTGDFQNNSNGIQYVQGVQPGQFPTGQNQGSHFPDRQFQPGPYQTGQFPIAQFPAGQFQPGQFQLGQFPAGQFGLGQFPAGQFQTGQFPAGQFQSGQFPAGPFQTGQFGPGQFQAGQFQAGQYPDSSAALPAPAPQKPPQAAQGRNDYGYDDVSDDVSTEANNNVEETSSKDDERVEPAPEETKEEISKETTEPASTTESAGDDKKQAH